MFFKKKPKSPLLPQELCSFEEIVYGFLSDSRRSEIENLFDRFQENGFPGLKFWKDEEKEKKYQFYYKNLTDQERSYLTKYVRKTLTRLNWLSWQVTDMGGHIGIWIKRPWGR